MRGALGATLAALRAYRRVAQLTSKRGAARDRASAGAPAEAGADGFSGDPSRKQKRRSVIALSAASALGLAALIAAAIVVLSLRGGSQPNKPPTAIEPYGAVPAATSSIAPVAGAATGRGGSSTGPFSGGSTSAGSTAGPVTAVSGSARTVGTSAPASTVSTATTPADTTTATTSPSLLDLCQSVVAAGNGWPSVIKGSDRTTLIAAAGSRKNVLPYCTGLVNG